MPKEKAGDFCAVEALMNAFEINGKINAYLISNFPEEAWRVSLAEKGRTAAAIVAHMHHVRVSWLKAAVKNSEPLDELDKTKCTRTQALAALSRSQAALAQLLRSAFFGDGRILGFKPNAVSFYSYLIAHDAHHRGQMCMLARQAGHPVPQKIAFGLWEWGVRGRE